MDAAGRTDFKCQCDKDYVDESLNEAICCRVSVRIQSEMESRWKADDVFMGKLDLPDEVIVGGENMRIVDYIVCYSTAISTCVKEPDDGTGTLQENRPVQHAQRADFDQFNDQCM